MHHTSISTYVLDTAVVVQENNFKAVLESIRDLMNEDTVMPDWLHDIFLGYGDPAQAKYTNMPQDQLLQTIDFKVGTSTATFLGFSDCCDFSQVMQLVSRPAAADNRLQGKHRQTWLSHC